MHIDAALAAIADLIQSSTGFAVRVARPTAAVTGLVIWPWHVADVASLRNVPQAPRTPGLVTPPPVNVKISFLLLVSPDGADGNLNQVLQAHRVLLENPILQINKNTVQVAVQPLQVDELAAVFTAAQLKLSLCTNYSLQLEVTR